MPRLKKDDVIVDVGSGAGFPGIILSLAGIRKVVLIESDERKAVFLRHASKISKNEIIVLNERVEKIVDLTCDVVVSRAMTDIRDLLLLTKKIRSERYLIHKGKKYLDELQLASKDLLFKYRVHDSITSAEGKILEIDNYER